MPVSPTYHPYTCAFVFDHLVHIHSLFQHLQMYKEETSVTKSMAVQSNNVVSILFPTFV